MISYIRGTLADVYSDRVIVENQGIGFEIWLSAADIAHMPLIGAELILYTYFYVREDAMILYGFRKKADLETFKLLITVSGIGPKGGLAILSVLPARELWMAVEMGDDKTIATAPGIGKKTAQKMIIELKDKFAHLEESLSLTSASDTAQSNPSGRTSESPAESEQTSDPGEESGPSYRQIQKDAIEALMALGYTRGESVSAVRDITPDTEEMPDVETVLKKALKNLL